MKKIVLSLFSLLLILEVFARYSLGLGETPTYIQDPAFEYIYSPNQSVSRFGNLVSTNNYSMRSNTLNPRDHGVLVFGDSVLNGGNLTDHNKLATTLLENHLQKHCDDTSVRALNISAGSWGPDNAYAYLMNKVDFENFNDIILVFSSHDAHDNMEHESIVGVHKSFPADQPYLALTDGFYRYLIPRVEGFFVDRGDVKKIHNIDSSLEFNSGWKNFIDYSITQGVNLLVVLHPTRKEIKNGAYNKNGEEIIALLKSKGVPYFLELNGYLRKGINLSKNYRDDIHYNDNGQYYLFSQILPVLKNSVCRDK